jgi:hypothetical protein
LSVPQTLTRLGVLALILSALLIASARQSVPFSDYREIRDQRDLIMKNTARLDALEREYSALSAGGSAEANEAIRRISVIEARIEQIQQSLDRIDSIIIGGIAFLIAQLIVFAYYIDRRVQSHFQKRQGADAN